jgi:hypothetical protein
MSKGQLSRLRGSIEAQLRWAVAYGGDRELLDLLRSESERLSAQLKATARTHLNSCR